MTYSPRSPRRAFGDIADVADLLRRSGARLTAPRRAVLEALFAADGPVAAEYIAAGRTAQSGRLDRVSVYRALEHLERLGVVQHVHIGHGPGLYALTGRGEREYLACERCDSVTSVDPARLDAARALIRAEFGYEARFSHFPIVGLCARCAAGEGQPRIAGAGHGHEHTHGDHIHAHAHASGRPHEH